MTTRALHELLDLSAVRFPDKVEVEEAENGSICYGELAQLSDRVRDRLREMGVGVGDRVGICARKSGDVVASIEPRPEDRGKRGARRRGRTPSTCFNGAAA